MQPPNRFVKSQTSARCPVCLALLLSCALVACAPLENGGDGMTPPRTLQTTPPPVPPITFARTPPQITVQAPAMILEPAPPAMASPLPEEETRKTEGKGEARAIWEEGPPPAATAGNAEVTYDFPMVMNSQVEYYVDYFRNNLRRRFTDWLGRANRYLPMIQEKLRAAGLPEDLAYLPIIESGFNLNAYSPASAAGPWQFMRGTAKRYGLTVNDYVDERRDPVKSTQAAVEYLSDLYEEFGSWHLAVAAYNAGEGRIRRATQKFETDDFWEIAATSHLSAETQQYVPKLIAAIMIAKEPGKYGLSGINCNDTFCYETVYVPKRTALAAVALASGIGLEVLEDLNSELRLGMTPPNPAVYALKVPPGSKETILKNLSRVRAVTETKYKEHVVKRGETIPRLCRQYGVSKATLLKANKLRKGKISAGLRLRIPYKTTSYTMVAKASVTPDKGEDTRLTQVKGKEKKANRGQKGEKGEGQRIVHRIKRGETLATLAKRYNVSVEQIIAWNRFKNPKRLKVGQRVVLYLDQAATLGQQQDPSLQKERRG